jgi:hypothetical protein
VAGEFTEVGIAGLLAGTISLGRREIAPWLPDPLSAKKTVNGVVRVAAEAESTTMPPAGTGRGMGTVAAPVKLAGGRTPAAPIADAGFASAEPTGAALGNCGACGVTLEFELAGAEFRGATGDAGIAA